MQPTKRESAGMQFHVLMFIVKMPVEITESMHSLYCTLIVHFVVFAELYLFVPLYLIQSFSLFINHHWSIETRL